MTEIEQHETEQETRELCAQCVLAHGGVVFVNLLVEGNKMRRITIAVATIAIFGSSLAKHATADRLAYWSPAEAGNGHSYALIQPPNGITWSDARIAADRSSLPGLRGHLATVTTPEEHQFVTDLIGSNPRPDSVCSSREQLHSGQVGCFDVWIGLTDEVQESVFTWVTGEPLNFTAWQPGQPDNGVGGEGYVHYWAIGSGGNFGS